MNAITLGKKYLFAKGVAEQTFYDPGTGNIVGYDTIATDGGISVSVNMQELAGGINNPAVGFLPDTVRVSGTYTSQAFSLETRKLICGGNLQYNGVAPICETITASSATLTVTGTPTRSYTQSASDTTGWCYVREHGASTFVGTNYEVNLTTKVVTDFTATSGKQYDVIYFVAGASNQELAIPEVFNPSVVSVAQKYGIYAAQNTSAAGGTLQGYLYVFVPYAMLNGDVGISATQTTNGTTSGNWTAISSNEVMPCSNACQLGGDLAYYVFVPCNVLSNVEGIGTIGGGTTIAEEETVQIPVKFIMEDGSIVQADFSKCTFVSGTASVATVSTSGVVTGVSAGTSVITITITGTALSCTYTITVTD